MAHPWVLGLVVGWQKQCERIAELLNTGEFAGGAILSDCPLPGVAWLVSGVHQLCFVIMLVTGHFEHEWL